MPSVARNFIRASSSRVACSLGATVAFGPGTAAAVVRHVADANYRTILHGGSSDVWSWGVNPSHIQNFWNGTNEFGATTALVDGEWYCVACTKAAGTTFARTHQYRYSTGVWLHENVSSSQADSGTPASNTILGDDALAGGNAWQGDIQIIGLWNTAMTDAQVEALKNDSLSWMRSSPRGLWHLCQPTTGTNVVDLTGLGANQTAVNATTVVTGNPNFDQPPVQFYTVEPSQWLA